MGGFMIEIKVDKVVNIQIQMLSYGLCILVIYGMVCVFVNLIWFGNFIVIVYMEQSSQGGKGFGKVMLKNMIYMYIVVVIMVFG